MKRWVALAFGSTLALSCADDTSVGGNVDTETGSSSSTGMSAGPSPDGGPGPDSTAGDATMGDSTAAPATDGSSSSSGDPPADGTASSSESGDIVCRGDSECDDDNPCTVDDCVETACTNEAEPDDTPCTDGALDGVCQDGQCVRAAECRSPADCVDLPPDDDCQERTCEGGECGLDFTPDGEPASAVRQTAGDCQIVVCDGNGGTTMIPDDTDVPVDGLDCTDDVCTAGVPSNPPVAAGSPCAGGVCDDAGTCVGCLVPEDCAGEDTFCQVRTCVNNECGVDNTAADTPLPDPDQTANDCQLAVCDGAGAIAQNADDADLPLDDGNECTDQACNVGVPQFPDLPEDTTCSQDGGSFCDGAGACVECNDATQCSGAGECSVDACVANACTTEPADAGVACDDGQFCTATDECDGAGACAGAGDPCQGPDGDGNCSETCDEDANACTGADPNGSACNDGTFCNGTDTCQAGACTAHAGDPCQGPDGDADCLESCVEGVGGAGACNGPDLAGSICTDGLLCTVGDTCDAAGVCQGGANPCTPDPTDFDCTESCNVATGLCDAPDPAGAACDDLQFCTGVDACNGTGTCVGAGDPCPGADGDGECAESCNEPDDLCNAPDLGGSLCDDGVFCTATDICDGAGGCFGSGDPCPGPDGDDDCSEECDEDAGACTAPDDDGTVCDDGSFCNGADTCSSGTCTASGDDPCDGPDGDNDCSETCDDNAGACTGNDVDGSACTDGLVCTGNDACNAGSCVGNPNVNPCNAGMFDVDCDCTEACLEDPISAGGFTCGGNNPGGVPCGPPLGANGLCNGAGVCGGDPACPSPLAAPALQPGDLVVTEIMFDPTCVGDPCEWIEVRNNSGTNVNLNGLVLQDSTLAGGCTLGTDVFLTPGEHAWLALHTTPVAWPYTNQPDAYCAAGPALGNGGDSVALRTAPAGTIIDQTAAHPAATGPTQGHSWKLNPASLTATANDAAANWCFSNVQFDTPAGIAEFGSPDAINDAVCL